MQSPSNFAQFNWFLVETHLDNDKENLITNGAESTSCFALPARTVKITDHNRRSQAALPPEPDRTLQLMV